MKQRKIQIRIKIEMEISEPIKIRIKVKRLRGENSKQSMLVSVRYLLVEQWIATQFETKCKATCFAGVPFRKAQKEESQSQSRGFGATQEIAYNRAASGTGTQKSCRCPNLVVWFSTALHPLLAFMRL